jgi:GNAT superfamily N-acetyltransferase
MLLDSNTEVALMKCFPGDDRENSRPLVAASIGSRVLSGWDVKLTMDEMVVHPEFRKLGIAGWLIGRTLTRWVNRPTELAFNINDHSTEDWFRAVLVNMGCHHETKDGNPAMWLPGPRVAVDFDTDDDTNLSEVHRIIDGIPDGWNGHLDFWTERDGITRLFRGGQVVGGVRLAGDLTSDHRLGTYVGPYSLHDSSGREVSSVQGVTYEEAMNVVLNGND